jgi:NAD(P)-dependent dehydrogenase (short-subunit alcohol dehydrogenase family)
VKLLNQVALITGAGRGIGRAMAMAFAREGAHLALVARTAAELDETAQLIHATQPPEGVTAHRVLTTAADVSVRADVEPAIDRVLGAFGRVDVLVNNAGVQPPIGALWQNDPDEWMHTIAVNLFGPMLCIKAVLPGMMERRRGKIINLSGGGAASPRPNFSAYAASKTAVIRLTETLAMELAPYNIQVNALAPGAINTRMLEEVLAAGELAGAELMQARYHAEKGGGSLELATQLAVFLASADSDGLTGKLVAAPHDDWQTWDATRITALNRSPWYTLRRIDPFTVKPLTTKLTKDE